MYTAMDSGVANDDVVVVMGQAVPRRRAEQGCSCCSLMAFGAFLATIFLWPRDPIIKANQVELVAHLADPDQTNVFSFGLNETMVFQNRNYYPMSWSDLDVKVEFCTDQVYPFSYIDNRCVKDAWVTLGSAPTYGDFSTGTRGKEKVALTIEQSPDVTAAVLKQVYCNLYGNVGAFPCAGMPETAYAYTALLRTVGTVEGQGRYHDFGTLDVSPPATPVFMA